MAAELDFSPPEVPEPTFMENVLRYGLFFGAIFQLICVLAIILPISKSHKTVSSEPARASLSISTRDQHFSCGLSVLASALLPVSSSTQTKG
uniref:Mannosidase beta like n=1 Tax=Chelydra serpentina TaxID=8475 RepID=A0A8C3SBT0_CHESE